VSAVLEVRDLTVAYGRRPILAGVDLTVHSGEILGVIGETGSGKTTLARAVVGLAPVRSGSVTFDGVELTRLKGRALRDFRRTGRLQYAFQDPLRALDPQQTVAAVVGEGLSAAGRLDRDELADRVTAALRQVGIDPELAGRTPGQLSGGQRQRVLLARSVAVRPRLLLCDEPVSALDASNRNHVLRLLDQLRTTTGMSIAVISHDLSSLAGIADRVVVLYGGRVVEEGPIETVLADPRHPYTGLLTASAPSVRRQHRLRAADLRPAGDPPPWSAHGGCVFAARCRFADDACSREPTPRAIGTDRRVACHHAESWRAELVST
jgi:oligopeptide/dipeptide ABC transporter ATP-binding protein